MSASFHRPKPTTRDMLVASLAVTPPDTLDLYGKLAEAGNELLSAAMQVMQARTYGEDPPDNVMAGAESAAMNVAMALAAFRGRPS
jgi:hypothetical protein